MKNLFKSMMLVAVAAMAFTACQNDNDEMNILAKKTVINGVATIDNDDTRSGFVGSETTENEDGSTTTVYKSAWYGGENIKLFINYGEAEATTTIDEEGKFTVELEGDYNNCTITACSPAEAWSSQYSFTIPAEQTPRTTSVDPAAHILQAQAVTVTDGVAMFNMQHQVAYGKMTVNTPADFEIAKVVINLKGAWYGYDRDLTYTLNADYVKNNTFWFATEPIEVSEMTVTAFDAEDNGYTKTVTMDENKTLKFQYYKVSTFSVSKLVEYVAPSAPVFTYAYATGTTGDKDVYFTGTELGELKLNTYYCFKDSMWPVGEYTFGKSSGNIYPGDTRGYSTYNGVELLTGRVVVSVVNNLYHIEMFDLADYNGNVVLAHATYTGTISPLEIPDPRQALATPNARVAVDGKKITLSWDAVSNAEGYRVKLYSPYEEYIEEIVTDTEYVYEAQQWSTTYYFTISSYVSDDNTSYKPSDDAYVDIMTANDPDKFADVVATDIVWNSAGYFVLTVPEEDFSYFYLEVNAANRPNNNSLLLGDYTYGKNENQFRVEYNNGFKFSKGDSSGTMNVSFVDGEYVILINVTSTYNDAFKGTVGYKGMPEGWVAPGDGGEEPEPIVEEITLTSMSEGSFYESIGVYEFVFKAENTEFTLGWSDYAARATSITNGEYTYYTGSYSLLGNYSTSFGQRSGTTSKFNGVDATITGGTVTVSNNDTTYTLVMDLALSNGTKVNATYEGVIGTSDVNPDPTPGPEPDPTPEPEPDPTPEPEATGTLKYVKNYNTEYSFLRYFEFTDGNDTIGFWMNSNKTDVTQMYDGTYNQSTNGIGAVAGYGSNTIWVESYTVNGESVGGVQSTSTITVQESGAKVDFVINYNSGGTILTKNYSFVGTITQ